MPPPHLEGTFDVVSQVNKYTNCFTGENLIPKGGRCFPLCTRLRLKVRHSRCFALIKYVKLEGVWSRDLQTSIAEVVLGRLWGRSPPRLASSAPSRLLLPRGFFIFPKPGVRK